MGNSHNSNLRSTCTTFEGGADGSTTWFEDYLVISMGKTKENDNTDVWGVDYKIAKKLEHNVNFGMHVNHDDNGVASIRLGLTDYADNET
ncbi:hypothetical protein A2U01_0044161, partial [Trifolium medium]|nr:hypothetical protein [Trifolium medium]